MCKKRNDDVTGVKICKTVYNVKNIRNEGT